MRENNFVLDENKKNYYIDILTEQLLIIRTKLGWTQDEISNYLGISRQTYSSIERKQRKMSWNVCISLFLLFDKVESTRVLMQNLQIYPYEIFVQISETGTV